MSNDLINALESRVGNAVETIETLRAENRELREDRQILEDKLRELLQKIDGVDGMDAGPVSDSPDLSIVANEGSSDSTAITADEPNAMTSSEEPRGSQGSGFGFQRPVVGMDGTRSEY